MTTRLRFKNFLRERDALSKTGQESLLSVSEYYGVQPRASVFSEDRQESRADSLEGYRLVQPGDFVMNYMLAWRGAYGVSDHAGIVSPAYSVFEVDRNVVDLRYLHHRTRSKDMQATFRCNSKGIMESRLRLYPDNLLSISIELPPLPEQVIIAAFLDRETTRIDSLIEKKGRFIDLLRDRLVVDAIQATAPRADWPSVPFWTVASAKSISGVTGEGLLSVYLDRGVIPYSEGGGLVHKPAESLEKYQLVEPGDFVMNNQQAWRGSVGVSAHRGIVSPAYLIFELDGTKIDPAFANYAFRSKPYVEQFMLASMSVGDIQRQIKWHLLRRVPVSLPPLEEQRDIAARLDREKARIDLLIAKTERSIELLKEHRSALITAAVTGKIDVRGFAAKNMKAAA